MSADSGASSGPARCCREDRDRDRSRGGSHRCSNHVEQAKCSKALDAPDQRRFGGQSPPPRNRSKGLRGLSKIEPPAAAHTLRSRSLRVAQNPNCIGAPISPAGRNAFPPPKEAAITSELGFRALSS